MKTFIVSSNACLEKTPLYIGAAKTIVILKGWSIQLHYFFLQHYYFDILRFKKYMDLKFLWFARIFPVSRKKGILLDDVMIWKTFNKKN